MTRIRAGYVDWEAFGAAAQVRMRRSGLSLRQLSARSGVAVSTIRRVWAGGGMTADAWAALLAVLGLDPRDYLRRS
jgi:lambda repressor-like predicted transcriptional regulator